MEDVPEEEMRDILFTRVLSIVGPALQKAEERSGVVLSETGSDHLHVIAEEVSRVVARLDAALLDAALMVLRDAGHRIGDVHAIFRETKLYSEAGEKRRQIPPSFHMMQTRSCSSCAA
jgi:hypothetical protein